MADAADRPDHPIARYRDLEDRVVFISGGASGIGRDLVEAFVAQRSKVVFVDLNEADGTALAQASGGRAEFLACDVTDNKALNQAIDHAEAQGGIEVLVNNAANDLRVPIAEVSEQQWQSLVDVNLRHQFFATQRVAPYMAERGRGSIINFGSVAPEIKVAQLAVYSACKAAVRGLTRSLAKDLGADGIRVNAILPGAIMTEKQRTLWYPDQASIDEKVAQQCLPRELDGRDVAEMALFLASGVSGACTAQNFIVDGGIL
ncbi:MAG: SDR family NAD(P)-dependent oxidoreductase [Pseudomonadota bacterium]